ncbi:unnamed protein product [Chironomus riparius]|uniref:Uncharacterized protein n=1 Tax=Chironomus riparius TaxID=315576 RepID=A0A9N9WTM5_9DIPT|nr:unnamed protein product [Chironomus riparius]
MTQSTSETYKYLILDIAEIETFVRLCEKGRLPIDLILDKTDEKIEKVIEIKFKMARGSDIKEDEEKEVQQLFKRLVQIKDGNPERWNRYTPEGNMTACGTDYLSNDVYCYYFILKAVAAHKKNMREQVKKMIVE